MPIELRFVLLVDRVNLAILIRVESNFVLELNGVNLGRLVITIVFSFIKRVLMERAIMVLELLEYNYHDHRRKVHYNNYNDTHYS